jgi:hypothetical protein
LELILVDTNDELVSEWRKAFSSFPEVKIFCDNILNVAECSAVSPANSFGRMAAIDRLPGAILPVGSSIIINTNHKRIPYLIVSPTMRTPEIVPSSHAYFALSSTLKVTHQYAEKIDKIFCPGLGTGVGRIPYSDAANEMAKAYSKFVNQILNK